MKIFIFFKYFFALLFITTAVGKLLDIPGFAAVIATYQLVPMILHQPLALAVSLFELFLGLAIITNTRLKFCAYLTIFVHVGYVFLAVTTLIRGLELKNCGCFGVFLARPLTIQTVVEDCILLILSIFFLKTTPLSGVQNDK